jgi:hypothetical protein
VVSPDQKLSVTSYPNPYYDNIRFMVESDVSGMGTLEVYNMLGEKLQVVYTGFIFSGKPQTIEYKVPLAHRTNLFYVFRVGNKTVNGKLLHPN